MKITCPYCSSKDNVYQPIKCTNCAQTITPPMTLKEKLASTALVVTLIGTGIVGEKAVDYFNNESNLTHEEIAIIYTTTKSCLDRVSKKYNIKTHDHSKLEYYLNFCSKAVKESL